MQAGNVLAQEQRIAVGDRSTHERQEIAADIAVLVVDIGFLVIGTPANAVFPVGRRHLPPSHLVRISTTAAPHSQMSAENTLSTSG
ncbi:hypothetical protein U8P77_12805 [Rhizobium johnstonii]|uniref:hypothetical protein n=1 Tax=Rhizobium johnstonii TaxID=3019933 RepID=UPI002DDD7965|nr:hypothetical protein U8P72_13305 [Rhizobium johnstonii]WSH46664.1 hypothetical protein U8P77_12805 [Rhizobium johnstonii]